MLLSTRELVALNAYCKPQQKNIDDKIVMERFEIAEVTRNSPIEFDVIAKGKVFHDLNYHRRFFEWLPFGMVVKNSSEEDKEVSDIVKYDGINETILTKIFDTFIKKVLPNIAIPSPTLFSGRLNRPTHDLLEHIEKTLLYKARTISHTEIIHPKKFYSSHLKVPAFYVKENNDLAAFDLNSLLHLIDEDC